MFMESQGLAVAGFAAGYAAVLATPGPNVVAIGGLAALRGFRATLPLCAGIGTGALILAVYIQFAFESRLLTQGVA
jgi:threonine/homoserine/homoserine lactone efflux protein